MSRVDENGTVHPTVNDAFTLEAALHIAFCNECSPYALNAEQKYKYPCKGDKCLNNPCCEDGLYKEVNGL